MASFAPIANAGGALSGLPKAGGLLKPIAPPKPAGIGKVGTGLLAGVTKAPKPKAPLKLAPGLSSAGSALITGQKNLEQGAQPPASVGGSAGGSTPSPSDLDSTYYQNVNNYLFNTGNKINADQLKSAADQTALQGALGQIAYAQPRADLSLEQRANQTGGLYSSVYGQNLGNLNQKYLTQQNAATTRYGGDMQSLANAIAALQGGIPLYEADQAAAAAARGTTAAANNPALGENLPVPAPAPAPVAAKAPPAFGGIGQAGSAVQNLAQQLTKGKPAPKPAPKSAAKNKGLGQFANLLK